MTSGMGRVGARCIRAGVLGTRMLRRVVGCRASCAGTSARAVGATRRMRAAVHALATRRELWVDSSSTRDIGHIGIP